MAQKHTPGPWEVEFSIIAAPDCKKCIVQFGFDIRNHKNPEVLANARLIAAAPALLEALERARYGLSNYMTQRDKAILITDIESAIAKATVQS